jgi:hypothetical protein
MTCVSAETRAGTAAVDQEDGTAPSGPGNGTCQASLAGADITTDTIIPTGLAGQLDLDLAIWPPSPTPASTANPTNSN